MEKNQPDIVPFSCTFSPQISELLQRLGCSIAVSTYQAGKFIFISPVDENRMTLLARSFANPMGFSFEGDRLVLATKDEVILFENVAELAVTYPRRPGAYDSMFIPRITYHTGQVDLHDIAFGEDGIWGVNTSFSCLCRINGSFNFIPEWHPSFITRMVSEDRCHLNGMVMSDGRPKFVTMLGHSDTPQGWRESILNGGLLMDVDSGEILLENLAMPHSPLFYKGDLYLLLSATGEVVKVDFKTGSYRVVKALNGFCRGMDICGDYLFVGMSRLRRNSSTFAMLPFAEKATKAGIMIIHLPTEALVGEISFQATVDEIYGLHIVSGLIRPNILNTTNPIYNYTLAIPGSTFWAEPGLGD